MRLSVSDRQRVRTINVVAPAGTTWEALRRALGLSAEGSWVTEYAGSTALLTGSQELGLPPLLNGATVRACREGLPVDSAGPVSLLVTSGPDAGGCFPLGPGGHLSIGRDEGCDVVVHDAGLSRHHLTVWATRQGIVVDDALSTNGTWLGGSPVLDPTVWQPGVRLHAGATTVELAPTPRAVPRADSDGEGRLLLGPRDREPPVLEPVALEFPALTVPPPPTPPAVLGWLLPLLVSVLLALVLSMPALMLFGLMAPAMSLGSHYGERRRHRREKTATRLAHEREVTNVRRAAQQALAHEISQRRQRTPDLARVLQAATMTNELLWSRAAASLICRLGEGPITTHVSLDGAPENFERAPVEINLTGGLALVGSARAVRALARSVLLQLAVLHSPGQLRIEVSEGGSVWDWLAWLPHVGEDERSGAARTVTLHDRFRTDDGGHEGTGSHFADEDWLTPSSEDKRQETVPVVLCCDESTAPDLATVVTVHEPELQITSSGRVLTATADLLSLSRAVQAARILAGLTDGSLAATRGGVPALVDLAEVLPVAAEAQPVADLWRMTRRSTRFVIGRDAVGPASLDLVSDGPHALVAGTTGSGKSELLRTMVASLALVNRPDELVLVLVDYKGGSAFAEAAALPHVVGVITDLDSHLADRALTSLTAELKRRERILARAGVSDLPAYQRLHDAPPLPRLVLVIDEFRALAEELPDFLDGLVRIATLGRSLGVHLVLATQRPGGVVSADVRANVNLRIALRVRDSTDSYDVIESPAAAHLPEGMPGRALIRTGADDPREVQVARTSTAPIDHSLGSASISVVDVHDLWSPGRHDAPEVEGRERHGTLPATLIRVAEATVAAAELVGATAPPSPWLPALPDALTLDDLREACAQPPGDRTTYSVPLVLIDLPGEQTQRPHDWQPLRDGHLGIVGTARSGRSSLVRTVLAGLLSHQPDEVHIYAFDMGGGLRPIAAAPHVGALLTPTDALRGTRVLDHLARLVAQRQSEMAAGGHTSLTEQRDRSAERWPLVVVLIDGWARFTEVFGEVDRGRALEQVTQVLREGLAVGVIALVTGDRTLLTGRVAPLLSEMWSLRLTDSADLLLVGLTRAQVPGRMPPGRVVRLRDGVVGQVATIGPASDGAAQLAALTTLVECASRTPSTAAARAFRELPRSVRLSTLLRSLPSPPSLVVGVGGDGAEPVCLSQEPAASGVLAVVGPPRSGRSTALRTMAAAARTRGWTVVTIAPDHLRDSTGLAAALASATDGPQNVLVAVDDLERIIGTLVEETLLAWLDAPGGGTGEYSRRGQQRLLVAAGGPDSFGAFRGIGARVMRERNGIVLQPSRPTDGSPLGVSVPCGDLALPGRGILIQRGDCTAVQVALPLADEDERRMAP